MTGTIVIDGPRYRRAATTDRLSATIRVGDVPHEVSFETGDGPIASGPEPFLSLAMLPAMRLGHALRLTGPVSPLLLGNLPVLQTRFAGADARLQVIEVAADASSPRPGPAGRRVGAFFSGGVDSFFLLLQRQDEITDLIFVHGFDIDIAADSLHRAALDMARNVARETGKRLIHIQTNLRRFGDRYVDWGDHLHGPALAAVAQLLSPQFGRVLIAGEYIGTTRLLASRREVNPLWSTEAVEIVHTGDDVTRLRKVGRIAAHPLVQRWLRVCWENRGGRYNCCACYKCVKNMASLRAYGMLNQVRTFEYPLDLGAVARLKPPEQWPHSIESLKEILHFVERHGSDRPLAKALRDCLDRRYEKGIWRIARGARARLRRVTRLWSRA